MACGLLCKEVVLKLVLTIILGNFCRHSEVSAWKIKPFENKVICQGERVRLHCANASIGLTIYSALYGRTERGHVICPYSEAEYDDNYNCGEADVTDTMKALCEKRNKCRVKVNSALFGDPCPDKHLYLNLVYACDWLKHRPKTSTSTSIATKATSTVTATASSLVSFSSFSSTTIFPTVDVISPTSTMLINQSTPKATNPPTARTARTTESNSEVEVIDPFQVEHAGSASKSDVGSLGIAGSLFMWLLFMQDHSSDYVTVFCASAACALALAIIVGLIILYFHHHNKQHLEVRTDPKFNAYGSTEPKMPTEIDPFISGPIKTPPPDYMMEGYSWQRGGSSHHKNSQNGTVVRTLSTKDTCNKELNGERQTEVPRHQRGPQFAPVARRQDRSNMYLNPAYATNKSHRNGRGTHERPVVVGERKGPKTREGGAPSGDAIYY